MSDPEDIHRDPAFLPRKIAGDIRQSAIDADVPAPIESYLAGCIAEITLETQIAGASLLTLTVNDNDFMLQASGFLDLDDDNLVPVIDVNFPPNTDSWWRLCMIQGTVDTTTQNPNCTLTFEDRIVSYLREEWGPIVIGKGLQTRAQCVVRLVDQVGKKGGQTAKAQPIKVVCPSENVVQPIAPTAGSSTTDSSIVYPNTAKSKKGSNANTNKGPGIGAGAALTVQGKRITAAQIAISNTALSVGTKLNAPLTALQAIIYAAIGETGMVEETDPLGHGVWQQENYIDSVEVAAGYWFQGGHGFQSGGGIGCVRANPSYSPWQVANAVEANKVWNETRQDSYAGRWVGGTEEGLTEARAIVAAYTGGKLDSLTGSTSGKTKSTSDVSQLTRGTSDNPDESSWDCIQRLAGEVQWSAFSNADTFYYMDGYDLIAQQPAAYIRLVQDNGPHWDLIDGAAKHPSIVARDVVSSLSYTFDNALALDTPLPTPSGWTTMGDVRQGDILLGSDGRMVHVIGTSKVQHDHPCYRVSFDDGTSIVADAGHLWKTRSFHRAGDRAKGGRVDVVTTEDIASEVRNPNGYSHRIDVAAPLDLSKVDLPVDPYVLGYWLGDGRAAAPAISTHHDDCGSLLTELRRAGYHGHARTYGPSPTGWSRRDQTLVTITLAECRGTRHDDNMTKRFRRLGVLNNKHIPALYLRASRQQRLALLQGLMDADGSIGERSRCEFTQANEALAGQVTELIRSLGFKPYVRSYPARGRSLPQVRIHFASMPHANPFRLWRKADKYMQSLATKRRAASAHRRSIVSVEPVESVPARCIKVNADDHLFLAGEGMVPTHNTSFIYRSTHKRKGRVQRKSRIAQPETPSEVMMNMVCEYDAYRAGDVFVFQDAGPISGRWIVTDATRNVLGDTFTQFTLAPPIAPNPEPAATQSANSTSVVSAKNGIVGGGSGSVSGYVNPFGKIRGLTPERIDQGVDYAGSGPILALGNASIELVYPLGGGSGWPGGGWITYKLLDGPFKGKLVYVAENISPTVHVGQTVQAGDQICTLIDASPNCETGWASGAGTQPLAQALGQNAVQNGQSSDPGGHASQCGNNFNELLKALGCPSGTANGSPNGSMPPGWPKLTTGTATKLRFDTPGHQGQ